MRWFRFYSEVLHDPKVQRLPIAVRWRWVEVLCLANEGKPRGRLPSMTDIAFGLHISHPKAATLVAELREKGLLDEKDGHLTPHNWNERQFASDDVAARVRKHRQGVPRNVTNPLHETPPEADTEQNRTDPETEAEAEGNIFRLYEQTIGPFDPHMATKLTEAEGEYSQECIRHSFQEASENNARSWRYVEAILKAHKANGCYEGRKRDTPADEFLRRREEALNEKVAGPDESLEDIEADIEKRKKDMGIK